MIFIIILVRTRIESIEVDHFMMEAHSKVNIKLEELLILQELDTQTWHDTSELNYQSKVDLTGSRRNRIAYKITQSNQEHAINHSKHFNWRFFIMQGISCSKSIFKCQNCGINSRHKKGRDPKEK